MARTITIPFHQRGLLSPKAHRQLVEYIEQLIDVAASGNASWAADHASEIEAIFELDVLSQEVPESGVPVEPVQVFQTESATK